MLLVRHPAFRALRAHRALGYADDHPQDGQRLQWQRVHEPVRHDYGVFGDTKDIARANSVRVAEVFGKHHKNVLRDIAALDCSQGFSRLNFEPSTYMDERGKRQPCIDMTRDGLMFLVMGYRGKKAATIKETYIRQFNAMEAFIRRLVSARMDFPLLTENIRLLHEHPKAYHFSNECDMLNRIVLGMTAKQYRQRNGIPDSESIRPYLTQEQITMLETLQRVDVGLLVAVPDYQERKQLLEAYASRRAVA